MTKPFVVYGTYPNSSKEYAYLCNIPNIRQGDLVLGNNDTKVTVQRTADSDPLAKYYVHPIPNHNEVKAEARRREIKSRLGLLERDQKQLELWAALARKNPEAKKLLAELKKLGG